MKRLSIKHIVCIILILVCSILTSCAVNKNFTDRITCQLKPTELSKIYKTSPPNLAELSKCSSPPSIMIINAETNDHDYTYYIHLPHYWQLTPTILVENIVAYMSDAFQRSGIITNQNSPNIIQVSLDKIQSSETAWWNYTTNTRLKIVIPEIKYTKTYEYSETTPHGPNVGVAYTIHEITWKIVNDPLIQAYLLCKNTARKDKSPTGETALDILKKRYAGGEITKDQYERMKNDIR